MAGKEQLPVSCSVMPDWDWILFRHFGRQATGDRRGGHGARRRAQAAWRARDVVYSSCSEPPLLTTRQTKQVLSYYTDSV